MTKRLIKSCRKDKVGLLNGVNPLINQTQVGKVQIECRAVNVCTTLETTSKDNFINLFLREKKNGIEVLN